MAERPAIKCMLHGSFRKHLDKILDAHDIFTAAGISVIAPEISSIVGETDGFIHFATDGSMDPRVVELQYLMKIRELGQEGFSYYVNPGGNIGVSASYEFGIDQLTNTRIILMETLRDHPAYVPHNSVWAPQDLADYISENGHYPPPVIEQDEQHIQQMLRRIALPGSIVAVGAIIVDYSDRRYFSGQERDILLVRTHKWGDRFSIVGGKVRQKERLAAALLREISEETGLEGSVEESICTFDEIDGSGYFEQGAHRIFADNVVRARRRDVTLNHEAEGCVWMPPTEALKTLDIEPNARKTVELYAEGHLRAA